MTSFEPDVSKWDAWRPEEVQRRLAGVNAPWYVIGGWAIDLFLGEERREHEDLEIAVPRQRFDALLPALEGFELFVVGSGIAQPLTPEAMERNHQTWVREPATGRWRVDIMREPYEGDTWICRRDARIRLPLERVFERTDGGIPFTRPEIVLLFKAKDARAKDEDDLDAVLPRLQEERRAWLADAIALAHPGHRWLRKLD